MASTLTVTKSKYKQSLTEKHSIEYDNYYQMGVMDQLHAPDALTLRKEHRNPLNRAQAVSQSRY
jgi:hypothetical protein